MKHVPIVLEAGN